MIDIKRETVSLWLILGMTLEMNLTEFSELRIYVLYRQFSIYNVSDISPMCKVILFNLTIQLV